MDATEFIGGDYLSKSDLETSKNWVIKGVKKAELDDQNKLELELEYKSDEKNFTLNTTNTRRLISLFTNETDEWIGKVIVLKIVETEFKSKSTLGIRVDEELTKSHEANKDIFIKQEIIDVGSR